MTKHLSVMLFLLFTLSAGAANFEIFNVPPLTENNAPEALMKKSVTKTTIVQMDPFTATIPKGWSFMAAGVSAKMNASLTATPSEDVEHDETFVGINERRAPPSVTLEERAEKYKKEKKGWKLHFDEWKKTKWLIAEYSDVDKTTGKTMDHWAAFADSHGKEYWMLAAAPAKEAKKYGSAIKSIMKSVEIRYNEQPAKPAAAKPAESAGSVSASAAPAAAAAAAPVTSVKKNGAPTNDKRIRGNWRVSAYKIEEGIGVWTEDEAKELVGKQILFGDSNVRIGAVNCETDVQTVTDSDQEKNLLRDLTNPCNTTMPGGPVFVLHRRSCSKEAGFPPYLAFVSKDDIVSFGDAVSFCLKREK